MGADMLVEYIPAVENTPENREALLHVIAELTDEELSEYCVARGCAEADPPDENDLVSAREQLCTAVNQVLSRPRDVAELDDPDFQYPILLTGGLSWGDNPTESSGDIEDIGYCELLRQAMRTIALKERKAVTTERLGK